MSNPIRFDPLLVHYLARELEERLRGRRARALRLDPQRRLAALELDGRALVLELHPTRGSVRLDAVPATPIVVELHRRSTVGAVAAPPDERLLRIELPGGPPDRVHLLVVELMTNQWNVVALDATGRIVTVLWRRDAGGRALRPGMPYGPPPAAARAGVAEPLGEGEWTALLERVAPEERERALVRRVAWTSPVNAGAVLGAAGTRQADGAYVGGRRSDGADDIDRADPPTGRRETPRVTDRQTSDAAGGVAGTPLAAAYARYVTLASLPPASARLLVLGERRQPYPLPLPGIPDEPEESLLDAFAAAAGAPPPAGPAPHAEVPPELLERLRRRVSALDARASRLKDEATGAAAEAAERRRWGDLLLSHLGRVRKGMEAVELPDFDGGTATVPLEPSLSPSDNAQRHYAVARRRERAAERIPRIEAAVAAERARIAGLLERAERGVATGEEVEAAVPAPAVGGRAGEVLLPYRVYRTTGGLEVRVGRSSRANDELTFHHAAPNDVWLHARDVAGAHVVLRWGDAEANPPARDLAEAATLAALHSRARTSGLVPVDWTRRKYVRKPRKSAPGLVLPDRVRTLFVEPDPAVERRLRGEAGDPDGAS